MPRRARPGHLLGRRQPSERRPNLRVSPAFRRIGRWASRRNRSIDRTVPITRSTPPLRSTMVSKLSEIARSTQSTVSGQYGPEWRAASTSALAAGGHEVAMTRGGSPIGLHPIRGKKRRIISASRQNKPNDPGPRPSQTKPINRSVSAKKQTQPPREQVVCDSNENRFRMIVFPDEPNSSRFRMTTSSRFEARTRRVMRRSVPAFKARPGQYREIGPSVNTGFRGDRKKDPPERTPREISGRRIGGWNGRNQFPGRLPRVTERVTSLPSRLTTISTLSPGLARPRESV